MNEGWIIIKLWNLQLLVCVDLCVEQLYGEVWS